MLEENFEGVGKKNTRKKKTKGDNIYGGAKDQDLIAAAFDEGADSDEVHEKKGKHNKKDRQKKKGKKQESDAEEEEEKVQVEEAQDEEE